MQGWKQIRIVCISAAHSPKQCRQIPPSSSGFYAGKQINTVSFFFWIFYGERQSSGSDTAQQCVALPKVGVLKSQIICFLKQWDSVAFHSTQLSHAPNEEREIVWIKRFLFFPVCVESQNVRAFKVTAAENPPSIVPASFGDDGI